jgi:ribonuclease HI
MISCQKFLSRYIRTKHAEWFLHTHTHGKNQSFQYAWSERNARKHDERKRSVAESVKWTVDIAMDLAITGQKSSNTKPKTRVQWKPLQAGVSKLNVDASFVQSSGEGSSGLVLRKSDGTLVRGQAIWYGHAANSLIMETIAVRDGIQLASALGLSRVEVETDSTEVLKLWEERGHGRSEVMSILQEIEELSSNMMSFQLKFIRREANEASHLCAKQASINRRRCIWINFIPSFLVECLQRDCKSDD